MANYVGIERPQTEGERKDFKLLGTRSYLDEFNKKLAIAKQEYAKKFVPFDEPCARIDFRDKVEMAEKESLRNFGFVKEDVKVEIGDFKEYGKPDRFTLVEDQEDYKDKVVEGTRTQIITGHTLSYRCKKRGHGISISIPMREYMTRYPEKFSDRELKTHFSDEEFSELRGKKKGKKEE